MGRKLFHRDEGTKGVLGGGLWGAHEDAKESHSSGFKWPSFGGILRRSKRRDDD